MLKFAYRHKSHSSDVSVPSYGDLTETFPPWAVMVAMIGSEDSRFAFHWYVQNIHKPEDRVVIVFAVEFHSEHDSRWLFCEVNAIDSKYPGEGIVQAAKEIHASFIVTGTRGLGKVRRTILGSVSDYILRHAPMPVVVCRYVEKKGCEK